ncbi:MAG TPA: SEC-C metal-binding domain-containing protein, partial [Alphaproteobacteria bacterium]|nr:SEC-C metal-binding domain-containing protein [Alphaproteobacteria bacterium]
EFGFDYLRDNMALTAEDRVQRPHFFAIVDEVDSILIDEARTPLIISGPAEESAKWYRHFARIVPRLKPNVHYEVDEKKRTVAVTEEGVQVQMENQTLASITFQNYFRLYPKLAGMTGTAMTEANEFAEIYKLEVVEIPTNQPMVRIDNDDEVYRTFAEKVKAIVKQIEECRTRQQPVLVGTVSIEKSEMLSAELKKRNIPHQVLNARYHEQEAYIVAQAGRPGAVTIATNMAGRGTDIQLGGNVEMRIRQELAGVDEATLAQRTQKIREEVAAAKEIVKQAGGLYIIGTERHESRRIDNQLRGRSGRQGDPGASKFFLSLEDDLMRIFGSERMDGMLRKLGLKEDEAIIHPWINKALEKAQQKVEARNFEIRKQILKFDDVMNDQRKVIYEQRKDIMRASDVAEQVVDMRHEVIENLVTRCIPENAYAEQWEVATLHEEVQRIFGLNLPIADWAKEEGIADEEIRTRITEAVDRKMAEKAANVGPEIMRMAEKSILLQILDQAWKDHLLQLDHLRQGIGLRAYGQRDPLNEYKREAFELFEKMLSDLREQVTNFLCHVEIRVQGPEDAFAQQRRPDPSRLREGHEDPAMAEMAMAGGDGDLEPRRASGGASALGKVARNAPCPCGSGKKYKHCHGRV